MKVRILIDNIAGCSDGERFEGRGACRAAPARKLFGEWGLSVYVEYEGHKVLLDTGASHLFAKNANVMGVSLSQVDIGVLSHAHYDHANGMAKFFKANSGAPFYLRKGAAENCYHTGKLLGRFTYHYYIGIHKGWLERFADRIRFVEGIAEIAPGITLVPHSTPGLERIGEMAHLSVKENGKYRYDSFDHEQSLVFDTPQGLFIMNSCSHAGADNIVKEIEAKRFMRFSAGSTFSATRTHAYAPSPKNYANSMCRRFTPGIAPATAPTEYCGMSLASAQSRCTLA